MIAVCWYGRGVPGDPRTPTAPDATRPPPVLKAVGVSKEYRTDGATTRALAGVDLDVDTGRFLAIMGPSGSGKSTLMHILGGLDRPSAGDVLLEGRPLGELSDREITLVRRRRIGFVFQFFNLVPVLTAAENVALPMVIDGVPRRRYAARVQELLALVGLTDRSHHLPSQLSGGQQQRVAIARALLAEPSVVFGDEPTGNLDSASGQEILSLLRGLADAGQTVVIVTHDANAAALADRIVFLRDGEIVARLEPTGGGGERAQAVFAWLQALGAQKG